MLHGGYVEFAKLDRVQDLLRPQTCRRQDSRSVRAFPGQTPAQRPVGYAPRWNRLRAARKPHSVARLGNAVAATRGNHRVSRIRKVLAVARAVEALSFIFLLLSVGFYVPAPAVQPACGRLRGHNLLRRSCVAYFLTNSCPLALTSWHRLRRAQLRKLRQQAKKWWGRGNGSAGHRTFPAPPAN